MNLPTIIHAASIEILTTLSTLIFQMLMHDITNETTHVIA